MFEKLGFVNKSEGYGYLRYRTNIREDGLYLEVSFNLKTHKFRLSSSGTGVYRPIYTTGELLKAIQKQYEELGWL